MDLIFFGAAGTVTGSCYLLDTGQIRIMVDCGLFQGAKEIKELNYSDFTFNPGEVDFLLLTHAHIDHSGLIPKLYKHGFKGQIYATPATADLCSAMLPDSGHIQETEVQRKNRKYLRAGQPLLEPIYTVQDALAVMPLFHPVAYNTTVLITPEVKICFRDAGHILGSSMIELWVQDGEQSVKLVFSGDIGNSNQPLINEPAIIAEADYVVMESTYGNRQHEVNQDKMAALSQAIKNTFRRGGNLIIPAFAVERTQDLLYDLNILIERKEISAHNIFIDSPLAITATEIFCRNMDCFDSETLALRDKNGGECPLHLPGLRYARTVEESMNLNQIKSGAIIISASGMCDAGRIKHHLKHNLWRSECTVLIVGFQAQGTLGRRLLDGDKTVKIHGEEVAVKAEIRYIDGFSAHADQSGLLAWARSFKKAPQKFFITHGEPGSSAALAKLITVALGVPAETPQRGERFALGAAAEAAVEQEVPAAGDVETASQRVQDRLRELVARETRAGNQARLLERLAKLEEDLAG